MTTFSVLLDSAKETDRAPVGYGGRNRFFWAGALSGNLHGLYEASGGAGSRTTPVALDYTPPVAALFSRDVNEVHPSSFLL